MNRNRAVGTKDNVSRCSPDRYASKVAELDDVFVLGAKL
jgi:hypothetical protein